ncbi:MAG TPA: carbohydrate binding domain-containing protein [bacterium]|nr:carbohydrate binding domain-containing protein [bacterium]
MILKKLKSILTAFLCLAAVSPLWAGTATIDSTTTYQYIRGFGASSAWHESAFSTQLATWYWDATGMTGNNPNGIGMSMLRCHIPYTNTVGATGGTGISDPGETAVMKQAIGLGVTQVWLTEWTPPTAFKTNGAAYGTGDAVATTNNTFNGAGTAPANANDTGYANYLVNYIQYVNNQLKSSGVTVLAVSCQNEPDWNPTYESAIWTAGKFDVFVPSLYSALQAAGLNTKIMIPESFADNKALAATAMDDATAAPEIAVIGDHLYGLNGATPYSLAGAGFTHLTNQENWETEMSDVSGAPNDTSITSGLQIAAWVQQCIVGASMNAYHAWWLYPTGSTNEALIGTDNASTKKLWCLGNWSRFVRPGYYRMGATVSPAAGVSLSAFKSDNSSSPATVVIVAINSGTGASSTTFNLNGFSVTSMTPWVTDASNNLTRQTDVAVSGGSFTYNLGAKSVVSFVGVVTGGGGPTYTPTVSPTPTKTPIPGAYCEVDDFEDGNTTNNWGGTWGTYAGTNSTVSASVTTGGSAGSTAHSMAVSGTVADYGGLSTGLNSAGTTVDLSAFSGVVFMVKGSGTYWFQIASAPVTSGDNYGVSFTATASWTPVTVMFNQVAQRGFGAGEPFDLTQINALQWGAAANGALNFQIDDVRLIGNYCPGGTPTPTPTFTPTATSTRTPTRTPTLTQTPTLTRTVTLTPTLTATPSATLTATASRTATPSLTPSATKTPTATLTPQFTFTMTLTPTQTLTATNSLTPTATNTPPPSKTPTATPTATETRTPTLTQTPTATPTVTLTPQFTYTQTLSPTPSQTPTATLTPPFTFTPSRTFTVTATPTFTLTASRTPTTTPTSTATATKTATPSLTATATPPALTATPTETASPTSSPTVLPTVVLQLSASTASISPNQTFNYTLDIGASGSGPQSGSLVLNLAAGLTVTGFPQGPSGSVSGTQVTWNLGSLPTGTTQLQLTVQVDPSAAGNLTSQATLQFTGGSVSSNSSSVSVTSPTATPTATDSPTPAAASATPVIFPNPVRGGTSVGIQLPPYPGTANVTLQVVTTAFRMVNRFTTPEMGGSVVTLPLTDWRGTPLADGIYYVVVQSPAGRSILRLLILR